MELSRKIRGARGVLDWTQEDLAVQAGVSKPSVDRIERGNNPSGRTRLKITNALERQGVYLSRNRIEYDDNPIVILKNKNPLDCYLDLLSDVERVLAQHRNPELLIAHADDRVSPQAVNAQYDSLRADGVAMRQLIEEGNPELRFPAEEYRCIPSAFFINRVTVIYGDCVATVTAGESQISIFRDPVNAERERNMFELLWSTLAPPVESQSDGAA
ncbi:MAG: helix-turn-helix domain-containing protein [Pseudomonadota bacterium]